MSINSSFDWSGAGAAASALYAPSSLSVGPSAAGVAAVPLTPTPTPGPATTSTLGSFLGGVSKIADTALTGYASFQAAQLELARQKANNKLAVAQLNYNVDTARNAINAGLATGPVAVDAAGRVTGLSFPDQVAAWGKQWVDDVQTVPAFRNANLAILAGVVAIALLAVRK